MNKMQILRKVVDAVLAAQNTDKVILVPCTAEEAAEALCTTVKFHPARGVKIFIRDGWVLQPSQEWEYEEEWVEVPEYAGIEIRGAAEPQGPLHIYDLKFGVKGEDPWFRKVGEDWKWALTPF